MTKELTPLEALQDLINFIGNGQIADTHELCEYVAKRKDIIETELKGYEELKIAYTLTNHNGEYYIVVSKKDFEEDCKKLKALEIIKEKRVNISLLIFSKDLGDYNYNTEITYQLTKQEYDLLKEVLL